MEEYFTKFVDKLYKIYLKLNVKVVSYNVLKSEISPAQPKTTVKRMDSVSGNLNKVSNHISQFLRENDNEIKQYKNIISRKLRP